jgi:hypothetical protein
MSAFAQTQSDTFGEGVDISGQIINSGTENTFHLLAKCNSFIVGSGIAKY